MGLPAFLQARCKHGERRCKVCMHACTAATALDAVDGDGPIRPKPHRTALRCTALRCTALRCTALHSTAQHCGVRAYWRRSALLGAEALQCAVGGLTFGVPREVDKHVRAVRADLCGRVGVCTYADSRKPIGQLVADRPIRRHLRRVRPLGTAQRWQPATQHMARLVIACRLQAGPSHATCRLCVRCMLLQHVAIRCAAVCCD
jgi:hypothetical protein